MNKSVYPYMEMPQILSFYLLFGGVGAFSGLLALLYIVWHVVTFPAISLIHHSLMLKKNTLLCSQNYSWQQLHFTLSVSLATVNFSDMSRKQQSPRLLWFPSGILFIFRKRGKEGRRGRGRETSMCSRNMDQLPLIHLPPGDVAHNPGMCPNQE